MKRTLIAAALASLVSVPAFADHDRYPTQNNVLQNLVTQENVGRALGAGVGALVGSRIGSGRGNTAATAAGAVGGYILGGKIGRDWGQGSANSTAHHTHSAPAVTHAPTYYPPASTQQANPAPVNYPTYYRPAPTQQGTLAPLNYMPDMYRIDEPFAATTASNVRGGPGTRYGVVDHLRQGEVVTVVGKLVDSDWFMVANNGIIRGFVYAPLLRPTSAYSGYAPSIYR